MISGGIVVGFGDIIAQKIKSREDKFDWTRFMSMTTYGFLISGGIGHLWFKGLDNYFGTSMKFAVAVKKVCVDQFILAPPEIVFFLAWSHFSSETTNSFGAMLKDCLPGLLLKNYVIWIPSQLVNFLYVPEQHRVLFMCAVCVVWFALLSYTSHNYQ